MIHGIIDIGSNTVRMAIYDIAGEKIDFLMKKSTWLAWLPTLTTT